MKYFIALLSLNVEELLLIAVFSFNQQYARSWEYTNTETVSICFSFPLCSSILIRTITNSDSMSHGIAIISINYGIED